MQGYGAKTSVSILRRHLFTCHIEDWLAGCEKHKLAITAKEALEAIAAFKGTQPESQAQQRPHFTPEAFVDALAEFIVATDQVYLKLLFYFILLTLILIYSLLLSWNPRSSETFYFCLEAPFKRKTFPIALQCELTF
jgi:hypothetical protein